MLEHSRKDDDIILELLRIVQGIDTKLENHIADELVENKKRKDETDALIKMIIYGAFPQGDLAKHKLYHEPGWMSKLIKRHKDECSCS